MRGCGERAWLSTAADFRTTIIRGPMKPILAFLALSLTPLVAHAQSASYDLLIRHGRIIDGTGSPWYAGDVAIKDGRIAAIGRLDGATATQVDRRRRDGRRAGLHRHARAIGAEHPGHPQLPSKIFQGITTEITGEGSSRRAAQRRASSRPIGCPGTTTSRSRRTGGRCASTSPGSRSRESGSTWPATSARRRCAAWCSATMTAHPTRRSSTA